MSASASLQSGNAKRLDVTTDVACQTLGVTRSQFTSLCAEFDIGVSRVETWKYHGYGSGERYFWADGDIECLASVVRTRRALLERGWTAYAVRKFLGRDLTEARIAEVEASPEFKKFKVGADRRQAKKAREAHEAALAAGRLAEERQLRAAELECLDTEALILRASECMHALNRRAKHLRGVYGGWDDQQRIYRLKDRFLEAMARAGRATIFTFEIERESRRMYCDVCDREWVGDSWCYACDDDSGTPYVERSRWFLVQLEGGHRFHSPAASVAIDIARAAVPMEPHDPDQPAREVPDVGLPEDLQRRCVELAIERLAFQSVGWVPTLEEVAGAA